MVKFVCTDIPSKMQQTQTLQRELLRCYGNLIVFHKNAPSDPDSAPNDLGKKGRYCTWHASQTYQFGHPNAPVYVREL